MTITTKFNTGDEVFIISSQKILKCKIEDFSITFINNILNIEVSLSITDTDIDDNISRVVHASHEYISPIYGKQRQPYQDEYLDRMGRSQIGRIPSGYMPFPNKQLFITENDLFATKEDAMVEIMSSYGITTDEMMRKFKK